MSFESCEDEIRNRFSESLILLNHLRQIAPPNLMPVDDLQKSMRGLYLVSVYAAFERSTNAIVETALEEISNHGAPSAQIIPSMQGIVHWAKLQSLHEGATRRLFDASAILFEASFSSSPIQILDNPLAEKLKNVDGLTLIWLAKLFGAPDLACDRANTGRLGTLRERRNAVAHGRESASKVGERYTLDELANIYGAADSEITRFRLVVQDQCNRRGYIRRAA